jgi:two-component system, LytTR family, response regulator
MIRAFLLDDEPLAVKRLTRLLNATNRVEIIGASTDPVEAQQQIARERPDVLFLDIQMPGMTGFELLSKIDPQPLIVFTTAWDQYALQAFEVNSVDYLLKPIETQQLDRALNKVERIVHGNEGRPDVQQLLAKWAAAAEKSQPEYMDRIASRTGDRVELVELSRVTHFFASDKLTWAATPAKNYIVDYTIQDLERKLDPKRFVRAHRSALVNVEFIHELHTWFAGKMLIRLKDEKHTEIAVSRDRVHAVKERLGI